MTGKHIGNTVFLRLFLLLLSLFSSVCCFAQAHTVKLTPNQADYTFKGTAEYVLLKHTDSLNLEEVMQLPAEYWQSFQTEVPNFGYSVNAGDVFWIRFKFDATAAASKDWMLRFTLPFVTVLDVYRLSPGGKRLDFIPTGRDRPFSSRGENLVPSFAFPLDTKSQPKQTVYIRTISKGPSFFPLRISSKEVFWDDLNQETLHYGVYFGCLFVMIFYNFFLFVGLRDRNYLYYILTIFSTLITFSSVAGYVFKYILPDLPHIESYSSYFGMMLIVVTTSIFVRSFLNTKKYAPLPGKILLVTAILALPAFLLTLFDISTSAINSLTSVQSILLLTTGIVCWRNGNTYARFFVIAWFGYVLTGIFITLRNAGILPYNFLTTHGVEIGSAFEVVLLSLALADRYRTIRQEKQLLAIEQSRTLTELSAILEKKVAYRTANLQETNEELTQINEEIDTNIDLVDMQKNNILAQQNEIDKEYQKLKSSITYAKQIQDAKLPQKSEMLRYFRQMFIFFKPRDVVSGDFYWYVKSGDKHFLAVADCTGHGVPGALMSMIGSELLSDIVCKKGIHRPAEILAAAQTGISSTLRQKETQNRDGMDIILCAFNAAKTELTFAAAGNSLVYVQNGELSRIKGESPGLGGKSLDRVFTNHQLHINTPTTFYLYSDGYQDQFGGKEKRKFMSTKFRKKLFEISSFPLQKQAELLEENLNSWQSFYPKSPEKQTDDILVIGFKLGEQ